MLRLQVLNACAGAMFALAVVAGMTNSASAQDCSREASLRSSPGGSASELSFRNGADAQRRVYWLDEDGQRKLHAIVEPGKTHRQPTVAAHYWVVTDAAEKCLYIITASSAPTAVEIGGVMAGATPPTPVPREAEPLVSPTAKFGLSGWYQVNSVARRGYSLNNLANGRPELEKTKPDWHSAFWQFEDVPGNQFVLIKNKWKGTYLTAAGGSVRAGSASPSSEEAHWVLEDGPYGRIKTRDGRYLIAAAGGLSLSPSASGDAGYWQLFRPGPTAERPEPVTVPRAQAEHPKVAEKAKDKGDFVPARPRLQQQHEEMRADFGDLYRRRRGLRRQGAQMRDEAGPEGAKGLRGRLSTRQRQVQKEREEAGWLPPGHEAGSTNR